MITRYFEEKEEEEEAPSEDVAAGEEVPSADNAASGDTIASVPAAATIVDPTTDAAAVFDEPIGSEDTVATPPDTAPVYIATALRYARVLMVVVILGIFMRLWEIDIRAISGQLLGPRFADALFDISITILLTWALWGCDPDFDRARARYWKNPLTRRKKKPKPAGSAAHGLKPCCQLIRVFIKITLIVMAVLISLSALGVNIGPLIAGAGVVGIAIGFGAQTLVRDIVSGFFLPHR